MKSGLRRRVFVAVFTSCLVLIGCGGPSLPDEIKNRSKLDYPGVLVDTRSLGSDFFWRQRVEANYGEKRVSFEAVVQLHQTRLTMLILSPTGRRAFALEQEGRAFSFTKFVDREMPFSPRNILIDFHRTFFRGIDPPPSEDGKHYLKKDDELIGEVWKDGRLRERRYRRLDGRPAGLIRIRYSGGMKGGKPPRQIELENGWFGYRLIIKTFTQ